MRESTFINGWIDEGRVKGWDEGRIQQARQTLRNLLTKRFGVVAPAILQQIDAAKDIAVLDQATQVVYDVARPEDLPL